MPNQSVKNRKANSPTSRAKPARCSFPAGQITRNGFPSTSTAAVAVSGPTTNATR